MGIEKLLIQASEYVDEELNLNLSKTQLKFLTNNTWKHFCQANNFPENNEGVYIPQAYIAYVKKDNETLISTLFHEYFGHGLFCEHSKIGIPLSLMSENESKKYLFDEINPNVQTLGLANKNIYNFEGFAMWMESLLCKETGNNDIWQKKLAKISSEMNQIYHHFKISEQNLTRFGFMAQLGFPKHYNDETLLNTLKHYYKQRFSNIEFIILYGSKKPKSDIDLFIVSKNPSMSYFNGWLDIYELNQQKFTNLISLLDISVTDPLFSGDLIYGSERKLERLKSYLLDSDISPESISHNLKESKRQKEMLGYVIDNSRKYKLGKTYAKSFLKNSIALNNGKKPLTLEKLNGSP